MEKQQPHTRLVLTPTLLQITAEHQRSTAETAGRASPPPRELNGLRARQEGEGGTHVVLDLPAGVGVDGEPSLLVLSLDVGVLGGERVLDLQAGRHPRHLAVAGVGQHSGQFHQEGWL